MSHTEAASLLYPSPFTYVSCSLRWVVSSSFSFYRTYWSEHRCACIGSPRKSRLKNQRAHLVRSP